MLFLKLTQAAPHQDVFVNFDLVEWLVQDQSSTLVVTHHRTITVLETAELIGEMVNARTHPVKKLP